MSDIDTAEVDSLKALDPEWPIREADIDRAEIPQCSSQRPLDSERFKMGARNALIRKRFYKKRDCKKLADSGRRTGDSSREAPWRVLLVVA